MHSLDSTHMMMTSLVCDKYGMDFATVHDSYWTHACRKRGSGWTVGDVDHMNELLRDQFVKLYSQPILENFLESLVIRYPDVSFPPVPEKGNLDLNRVRDSLYFFN